MCFWFFTWKCVLSRGIDTAWPHQRVCVANRRRNKCRKFVIEPTKKKWALDKWKISCLCFLSFSLSFLFGCSHFSLIESSEERKKKLCNFHPLHDTTSSSTPCVFLNFSLRFSAFTFSLLFFSGSQDVAAQHALYNVRYSRKIWESSRLRARRAGEFERENEAISGIFSTARFYTLSESREFSGGNKRRNFSLFGNNVVAF